MKDPNPPAVQRLIEKMGIQGIKPQRNGTLKALCPLHREKTASFHVLMGRGFMPRYHCFGCGASGSLLELLWLCRGNIGEREFLPMLVEIAYPKPREAPSLANYAYQAGGSTAYKPMKHQSVPKIAPVLVQGYRQQEELPEIEESALEQFTASIPAYLIKRGLSPEILLEYEVYDDPRNQRAILPIRDWEGKLRGWSGRTYQQVPICQRCNATTEKIGECQRCGYSVPKWLHSKGLDRKHILYGEHQYQPKPHVILQEGFFDVLKTVEVEQDENGKSISTPLAILGASPNWEQMERVLKKHTGWIWSMGDNDEAGRRMNQEVVQMIQSLEPHRSIGIIYNPSHRKDPGELNGAEGRKLNQCLQEVLKEGSTTAKGNEVREIYL